MQPLNWPMRLCINNWLLYSSCRPQRLQRTLWTDSCPRDCKMKQLQPVQSEKLQQQLLSQKSRHACRSPLPSCLQHHFCQQLRRPALPMLIRPASRMLLLCQSVQNPTARRAFSRMQRTEDASMQSARSPKLTFLQMLDRAMALRRSSMDWTC